MSWTDADIAGPASPAWTDADVVTPGRGATGSWDAPTLGQSAGRQGRLLVRALASAVASPATLVGDAVNKAINGAGQLVGRDPQLQMPSQVLQRALSATGLPEPSTGIEQFTQGLAESAPGFALPAALGTQVLGNAALGATQAKPGAEGVGALFGAGGAAAGRAVGSALTGVVQPSAAGKALMEKGVRLTPGQAAGKGSVANWIEQQALSNPVAAYPVQAARGRALDDAGLQAVQAVRSHIGEKLSKGSTIPDALAETHDAISNVYSEILPRFGLHGEHVAALVDDIAKEPLEGIHLLGDKPKAFLANYIENRIGKLPTDAAGNITGDVMKQIDSEIGYYARTLAKSPNATEKVAAPTWRDLQAKWREKVLKASSDDAADILKLNQANAGWKELLAVEDALWKSGGERLQSRPLAKSLERAQITTGSLADVSKSMQATFPNTVPDSGTALRLTANLLPAALVGGGGYGATSDNPWISTLGLGALMAGAAGTKTGAGLATGYTQAAVLNALRNPIKTVTGKAPKTKPFTPRTVEEVRKWMALNGMVLTNPRDQ